MRLPVDPRGPCRPGPVIDSGDECSGDTAATLFLAREQILQITDRTAHRRVSVEDVVHDTDDLAVGLRNETMDRFVVIEEPAPGYARDLDRHGAGADALVEGVITVPQNRPWVEIRPCNIANDDVRRHHVLASHSTDASSISATSALVMQWQVRQLPRGFLGRRRGKSASPGPAAGISPPATPAISY